eukprot:TRINITY_DN2522_c0_g1_i2.p1 TRINITY_DN2522_c0_g1~~TRINITY_DN2522_c0_g1_i2.p1  ORF type:complete len:241 (+),score=59.02 TRINITY_DN2522_c0_g1_i2:23-724(+)
MKPLPVAPGPYLRTPSSSSKPLPQPPREQLSYPPPPPVPFSHQVLSQGPPIPPRPSPAPPLPVPLLQTPATGPVPLPPTPQIPYSSSLSPRQQISTGAPPPPPPKHNLLTPGPQSNQPPISPKELPLLPGQNLPLPPNQYSQPLPQPLAGIPSAQVAVQPQVRKVPPSQPVPVPVSAPAPPQKKPYDFGDDWEIDFDELVIERELARGSFGAVCKASFRSTGNHLFIILCEIT